MDMPTALHRLRSGEGLHTNLGSLEGNWNAIWRKFLDGKSIGKGDEGLIIDKLNEMIDTFGIVDKLRKY